MKILRKAKISHHPEHPINTWRNSAASLIFLILILIFMMTFSLPVLAVDCESAIALNNQSDVDNFQLNYGSCDQVEYLTVNGADIINLDGLSAITGVGTMYIESNTALTNIDGLINLTSVGSNLVIRANEALLNLNGLANLTSVGWSLAIIDNTALTNIDGLAKLAMTGPLNILNNASLENIDGLANLTSVRNELEISYNGALTNIDGLANLTSLSGNLFIRGNNALTNIDGLANLTSVGWNLDIFSNAALSNIDGLANLSLVGLMLSIHHNTTLSNINGLANLTSVGQDVYFYYNSALTNVDGLSALVSVGGDLYVWLNAALTNVDGFSSVIGVGGDLSIGRNESLGHCRALSRLIDQWDDAEPGPGPGEGGVPDVGGNVTFRDNLSGCNSTREILAAVINEGLNDAWYNPDTDGQGFFITVFPELGYASLAWFTYDTELPPPDAVANLGDPGHRWLTAVGPIDGNQVLMNIELTSGGIFDAATDIIRTDPPGSDGTIILTFANCNSGTVEYDIPSISRQGIVPIQRVADDNIVICEALSAD